MTDTDRIRNDLRALLGDRVGWEDADLSEHAHDIWPYSLIRIHQKTLTTRPACVVRPLATDEVARVLAYANDQAVPVVPFGAGSGVCGGVLPTSSSIVVDMRGMNRLLDLNETALTARVQAGMMGNVFEDILNQHGYSMGHFPQSIALSTVGGWVATRAAGQASTRYGNIEDILLGLEAVLPGGKVVRVKATPRRSTGPDPRHVFLGSEGTIGIVTEVTVKIFPLPESRRLLSFSFPDFHAGLEAIRQIVRAGWRPPVMRLYDSVETGRHFGEWVRDEGCLLVLISEGPPTLTSAEAEACHRVCADMGAQLVGEKPVQHWLAERNNVPSLMDFIEKGFVLDTMEVATTWDHIHDLYRDVLDAVKTVKNLIVISGHTSHAYGQGTNIYFTFVARPEDPKEAEATYEQCWQQAMEATLRCNGTISHHHGIGRLRAAWMRQEHGDALEILRALKKALDPKSIMNPGVLIPA